MLSLHVWLLHKRHMMDYFEEGIFSGRVADKELFDRLWQDTLWRIRAVGVEELSVNKQLTNVQKKCFLDMMEYDAAIRHADDDNMELAAALFKGVFQADENARIEDVIRLADWTRFEVQNILTQPREDVYRGWITWSPVVGETAADRLERQRRMFEGEWRERVWVDGTVHFFHTRTADVVHQVPTEGLYPRRRFALASHLKQLADKGMVDRALVNPGGLRSLRSIEAGVRPTTVVLPAGEAPPAPVASLGSGAPGSDSATTGADATPAAAVGSQSQ